MNNANKFIFDTNFEDDNGNIIFPESIEAYERGVREGKLIGHNIALGEIETLISKISCNIDQMLIEQKQAYDNLNYHVLNIVHNIVSIVVPHLLQNGGDKEIALFISKYLSSIAPHAVVKIKLNSNIMTRMQTEFAEIMEKQGLQLILDTDDQLSDNDCVMEWDDGGVTKKLSEKQEDIQKIFDLFKATLAQPEEPVIENKQGEENE